MKHKALLPWLPPALLGIITWLVYLPSLRYAFEFDDVPNIVKHYAVRFYKPISLRMLVFEGRWVCNWLNQLNFTQGRLDPFYFRCTNLLIHLSAGVLLYFLLYALLGYAKVGSLWHKRRLELCTLTTGLFLLHPVQTQTVSYIIQGRTEGAAALFVFATALCFVWAARARSKIVPLFALSAFCVLTCGTKEIVIVTPLLLLLIDWFVISGQSLAELKKRLPLHLLVFTIFGALFVIHHDVSFFTKFFTLQHTATNNRGNAIVAATAITPMLFFLSSFKVIVHYLSIFLWPFSMSVEYDWQLEPGLFTLKVLWPLSVLLGLWFVALRLAWRKQLPYIAFGLLWFAIAIAPRATFFPSPELVCDYKTYLASAGWLFVLASGIVALKHRWVISILLLFLLSAATVQRNKIWETPLRFWADVALNAPGKARGHNNYGVALVEARQFAQAAVEYKKAIALDCDYADAHNNLAVAYMNLERLDEALAMQERGIALRPDHPEAYNNLGSLYLQLGEVGLAKESYAYALKLRPYYGKAAYNMGRACIAQGDSELGWQWYTKATKGDFDTKEMFFALGQLSMSLNKWTEAADAFEQAVQRGLTTSGAYEFLGNALFQSKQLDRALVVYRTLAARAPRNSQYQHNVAETLLTMGQYEEALNKFQEAVELEGVAEITKKRVGQITKYLSHAS